MKRPRGTGSVFRREGRSSLWIKYYRNGVAVRESAHTDTVKKAEKLLQKRIGEVATGAYLGPKLEKIRITELADDLIRDYRINGLKSIDDLEARWNLHLKPFFGLLRAIEVTSQLVAKYVDQRQQEKAENATINRELAALKRMFNLARESTPPKVSSVPYIPMLKESNVRTGFLETAQHDALANECARFGLWLRTAFEIGYTYGWRHEEVLSLRVEQVDLMQGTIRLDPGTTKNDDGREVTLTQPLKELIAACVHGKSPKDALLTRGGGNAVKDFRKAWRIVCKKAGVPGLLFHDLRRTAARNLRNAGVAEGVIMEIGGWRTNSMFRRYAIVSRADKATAMAKLEAQQAAEKEKAQRSQEPEFGHRLGTIEGQATDSRVSLPVPTEQVN